MRNRTLVLSLLLLSMLFPFTSNGSTAQQTISPDLVIAQDQSDPPTDDITKKYGFNLAQELIIGRTVSYALINRFGNKLYTDEKANKYVNLVGQSVAKVVSKRPQVKYRFGILDTYEINAFACPGGYIFITKGLLKAVKNENELAAVLAHEIGHVEVGDGLQDLNEHKQEEYAKVMVDNVDAYYNSISDFGSKLPFVGGKVDYYRPTNIAKRGIDRAFSYIPGGYGTNIATSAASNVAYQVVDAAANSLKELAKKAGEGVIKEWYYTPLSPDVEYKADEFSVRSVAETGYDPEGLKNFLQLLKKLEKPVAPDSTDKKDKKTKIEGSTGAEGDSIFTYTHPTTESRILKVEAVIQQPSFVVKNPSAKDLPIFKERFRENTRPSK